MKIIYLHQYFNTPEMSGSTRSYEFATRLIDSGSSVSVISSLRDGTLKFGRIKKEIIDNVDVIWIGVPYSNSMGYTRRLFSFCIFMILSTFQLVKLKADVVYATSTPLTIAIPAIIYSKVTGVPYIFEVRDLWPEMPIAMKVIKSKISIWLAKYLEKVAYTNAACIIALSPGIKEGIKKITSDKSIILIPNSCDIEKFQGMEIVHGADNTSEIRYILYAGQIGPVNDIESFLPIIKHCQNLDQSLKFIFIGDGMSRENCISWCNRNGVANVTFLETVSKDQIVRYFKDSVAVLGIFKQLPEMQKNSSNKYFDALAAGKPVILNYDGWMADITRQYDNGIIVDNNFSEDSAIKIVNFLSNTRLIQNASSRSRSLAQKKFSRNKHFEFLLNTFIAVEQRDADKLKEIEAISYKHLIG